MQSLSHCHGETQRVKPEKAMGREMQNACALPGQKSGMAKAAESMQNSKCRPPLFAARARRNPHGNIGAGVKQANEGITQDKKGNAFSTKRTRRGNARKVRENDTGPVQGT